MKGLIFTYVMTYGGAIVALFRPFLGFLVYACFAIAKPDQMWYWSVPAGNYSRTVALAVLTGWMLCGFGSWSFGKAKTVVWAMMAYWLWIIISAIQASNAEVAWNAVDVQSKMILPCLVACTLIRSVKQLQQLAWLVILSEGYVAFEANLAYFQEGFGFIRRYRDFGFAGMDNNCLGIAMSTAGGAALMLALTTRKLWAKGLLAVAMILMAHVNFIGLSRGGMLGLLAVGFTAFLLLPKRWSYYLSFLLLAAAILFLAGDGVQNRFATIFKSNEELDSSAQSRLDLWRDCLDVMWKHPLFGVGPDHWQQIAHQYGWPVGKSAHTMWLKTAAELGIPGFLFSVTFYGLCACRLGSLLRNKRIALDPQLAGLARMVIVALVGFAVSAQFVALDRLELAFFINVIGIGILKIDPNVSPSVPDNAGYIHRNIGLAIPALVPNRESRPTSV